jgi:hypothetical protein
MYSKPATALTKTGHEGSKPASTHQRTLIDILAHSVHCGTLLYSGGGGQAVSG